MRQLQVTEAIRDGFMALTKVTIDGFAKAYHPAIREAYASGNRVLIFSVGQEQVSLCDRGELALRREAPRSTCTQVSVGMRVA